MQIYGDNLPVDLFINELQATRNEGLIPPVQYTGSDAECAGPED
jgi:hypothetical protein